MNWKCWALLVVLLAGCPSIPPLQAQGADPTDDANKRITKTAKTAMQKFDPYLTESALRIKRAWSPPKGSKSKRIVVLFKIHNGGDMTDLRIAHSSGLAAADQAALRAVKNAAPFRPCPTELQDTEFSVTWTLPKFDITFDYNVFNGGGHGTFHPF